MHSRQRRRRNSQLLLRLCVQAASVVLWGAEEIVLEREEREVVLEEGDHVVRLVGIGRRIQTGRGKNGRQGTLLDVRAGRVEYFAQLLSTCKEEGKEVDGIVGDCDVWKEVGIVA